MKVGYIEPYSDKVARSQVVVVVLEDWTVLCFDSQLNILWEKEVCACMVVLDVMFAGEVP